MSAATSTILTIGTIAAGAGASAYGAHAAGSAADKASRRVAAGDEASLAEARLQNEEARRQFDAQQELERQKYAAAEEERAYTRRLQEEREARAAPYRAASAAALGNLGQLLGLDFGGSPLGQSLATPRMPDPNMPDPRVPARWQLPTSQPMAPMSQAGAMGPAPTIGTLTGLRPRRPLTQRS